MVTVNLDGRTTVIQMPSRDESILAATLRARPDAPFSCTGGMCGTCRARLVEGEVRMDRNYALEPEEIAAGIVLACQSHPVTANGRAGLRRLTNPRERAVTRGQTDRVRQYARPAQRLLGDEGETVVRPPRDLLPVAGLERGKEGVALG